MDETLPPDGERPDSPRELRRTRRIRETVDDADVDAPGDRVADLLSLLGRAYNLAIVRLFAVDGV